MQSNTYSENFYSRFYNQLLKSQNWPGPYLFKFIVKSESPHLKQLKMFFNSKKAVFSEKKSSKNPTVLTTYITLQHPYCCVVPTPISY